MSDKDGTAEDVVLDIAELKEQLSLPDDTEAALQVLGDRYEAINSRFGELLIYMNMLDERVQRLAGEPMITTTVQQHIGADGTAEVHRMRPEAPELEEIRNPSQLNKDAEKSALAKMVVSQ